MKYLDNGEYKDIGVKILDTLPTGTIVDYTGATVPNGWRAVSEDDDDGQVYPSFYYGTETPDDSLGAIGDIYFVVSSDNATTTSESEEGE